MKVYAIWVGMAFCAAVLFWFNPSEHAFYPFCIFYRTTGLLCPGCGSLRALHQLLHGHFLSAFHLNALLVLSLPVVIGFVFGRYLWRGRRAPFIGNYARWLWILVAVVVVGFGIWRNLPGSPLAIATQ